MLALPCRDPRFKGGVLRCVAWNASSGVIFVVAVVQLVRFGQLKVCQNRSEAFWCQSANFAYASQTCQAWMAILSSCTLEIVWHVSLWPECRFLLEAQHVGAWRADFTAGPVLQS